MPTVSVAQAKGLLSELIARSSYNHERFIITRRDKPVAALVSLDDLRLIEQHEERQGLAAVVGQWQGGEEIGQALGDVSLMRGQGGEGRDVSL